MTFKREQLYFIYVLRWLVANRSTRSNADGINYSEIIKVDVLEFDLLRCFPVDVVGRLRRHFVTLSGEPSVVVDVLDFGGACSGCVTNHIKL